LKPFALALCFAAALSGTAASVSAGTQSGTSPFHLLDVPYLPQSEALCGGAAIAMVMRYWGVTGVYAETFQDLVDSQAEGIRGADLLHALRERGFDASSMRGDERLVKAALAGRRPPILLIEDRPGRFHYAVIVGWTGARVVLHDPARAPFRIVDAASLLAAWEKSGYWMLLAEPGAELRTSALVPGADRAQAEGDRAVDATAAGIAARSSPVCSGMIAEGIRLAERKDFDSARRVLETATTACPRDSAPWRELAGLHAVDNEWRLAVDAARRALRVDPQDQHAARILATALFLEGDQLRALDAWNRIGEPAIDLIEIQGLNRTRYAVAAAALGLGTQELLTHDGFRRAERRLRALPAVMTSRVTYRPIPGGRAIVSAAVVERPLMPSGLVPLAMLGARAAIDREAAVTVAGLLGAGEAWNASWRWWENRPRVAFSFESSAPFGGVWSLEVAGERQSYGAVAAGLQTREAVPVSERRRGVTLTASDWITGTTRWEAQAAVERWPAGTATSFAAGVEQRLWTDQVLLQARGTLLTGEVGSWAADGSARWASSRSNDGVVWIAHAGLAAAGVDAPLALWPGAGTGQGRAVLLRAHPLLRDGVIADGVFGRSLVHGGAEWRRWQPRSARIVRLAPAVFLDIARAWHPPPFADRRWHADIGVGVRVATPMPGSLRIDLARGLRDGEMALSFGWVR
jgi:hypothetical protein